MQEFELKPVKKKKTAPGSFYREPELEPETIKEIYKNGSLEPYAGPFLDGAKGRSR